MLSLGTNNELFLLWFALIVKRFIVFSQLIWALSAKPTRLYPTQPEAPATTLKRAPCCYRRTAATTVGSQAPYQLCAFVRAGKADDFHAPMILRHDPGIYRNLA